MKRKQIFKNKIKCYLRRKISNLLYENSEFNEINEYFSAFSELQNEFVKTRNQYGEWIHTLFSLCGTIENTIADTNSCISEVKASIFSNMAYINIPQNKHKKKVLYTCLTGDYDNLPVHQFLDFNYDYICFTDNTNLLKMKRYGSWEIKPLVFSKLDNTKNNRWHKLHPHILFPEYEESIYIDSNITIKSRWIFDLLERKEKENKILIPIHYSRDSIFDDIEFCVNVLRKETRENADRMIEFLKKEQFPNNYGLTENCLIYRKHNDSEIINIMEDWWFFIENFSKRDQFSFSYVLWKHKIRPIDISIPNLRPLVNDFRIEAMHKTNSMYVMPSMLPNYNIVDFKDYKIVIETNFRWVAAIRIAGYALLNDDFEIYFKANRYYYKSDKVIRLDLKESYNLNRNDVGFDIKIPFCEGNPIIYIVNHTKKEIYVRNI